MARNVGRMLIRHPEHETILFVEEQKPSVRGQWTIPGGDPLPGETPADAAIRETGEETGYGAVLLGSEPVHTEHIPEGDIDIYIYLGQVSGGLCRVQPGELLNARWLSTGQVQALNERGMLRDSFIANLVMSPAVVRPWAGQTLVQ